MQTKVIQIPKDKFKQLVLALISVLFVYIGYLMVNGWITGGRYSSSSTLLYGYAGVVLFGIAGILILFNMLTSKPALIISKEGIVNNAHAGGGYLIRWNNIRSMKIITVSKQKMIQIDLKNDQEIFEQVNYISEKWMRLNSRFYGTPTFIPAVMIKTDLDEVLSIIRQQKKLHSKRNSGSSIIDEVTE